jgi:hypothetical protein
MHSQDHIFFAYESVLSSSHVVPTNRFAHETKALDRWVLYL